MGGSTRRVYADHLIRALDHTNGSADLVGSFEEVNCSLEHQSVTEPESQSALETEFGVERLQGLEGFSQFGESSQSGHAPQIKAGKHH